MDTEEHYYRVNGVTLHTAEAGDKAGETILFLHGFPEYWYGWKKQYPYFARKGYRVIMPDQRGYNLSSKPRGVRAYDLHHLVEDIAALIRHLGNRPVILVGHDWGGVVAWQVAMQHPGLLRRLVIINMPHPAVFRQTLKKNPGQQLRSSYAAFFQLPLLPEWLCRVFHFAVLGNSMLAVAKKGAFSKEAITAYKKAWQQPHALTAMINWYRAYKYNTLSASETIDLPVLLLWGKQDPYLLSSMAQPSIARCTHGTLLMREDATHWIHHEQPQWVNEQIHAFITQQPGP